MFKRKIISILKQKHIPFIVGTLIFGLAITVFLFSQKDSTQPIDNIPDLQSEEHAVDDELVTEEELFVDEELVIDTDGLELYRNEEWGFEFEYPGGDFFISENAFSSYYSKFNLRIRHRIGKAIERALVVNIVLPEFAEQSFSGLSKNTREIIVDGVSGIEYIYEFNERQETATIFSLGEYKLIVGVHHEEYEDIYRQILESFKFLE